MSDNSKAVFEACQVSERVFAFNPQFRRVNFYSVQLRALALVEEFVERGWVADAARSYIVVGGGIAGITTAAALLSVGASVKLVSPSEVLAHYADATHRELHPNIIYWPFREPRLVTDLPFLNWACGTADRVTRQLRTQWDRYFRDEVSKEDGTVRKEGIVESATGVTITLTNNKKLQANRVILATGSGIENSESYIPFLPYFGGGVTRAHNQEVFISGTGDGGLIDTAYQLYGTAAVTAARVLAYAIGDRPFRRDIATAEQAALALAQVDDPSKEAAEMALAEFYSTAAFDARTVKAVNALIRDEPHSKACLVHRSPTPYDAFTAPANKALLAMNLQHHPDRVRIKHAELTVEKRRAKLVDLDDPAHPAHTVDNLKVVVRHGAPTSLLEILKDDQVEALKAKASPLFASIVPEGYDVSKFGAGASRRMTPDPGSREHKRDLLEVLGVLASHLQLSGTAVTARTGKKGAIEFDFLETPSADIMAMFPLAIDGVNVPLKVAGEEYNPAIHGTAK